MNKNEILIAGFTALLFGILFFLFRSVIVYIAISAVFATIGSPLVKLFQKIKYRKFHIGKGFASLLTLLSFYTVVTAAILIVLPFINKEAQYLSTINPNEIIDRAQGPIDQIEEISAAGANIIVIGNKIEEDINFLLDIAEMTKEAHE